jgi:hypothetical protein
MDILKSYAHQVVSYHPEKARDDLFTELYNELCEEFDDWQEEHPDGDEAAFLDAKRNIRCVSLRAWHPKALHTLSGHSFTTALYLP